MQSGPHIPILRKNAQVECGQWLGNLNVMLKEQLAEQNVHFIAVHCTEPIGHQGACQFVGDHLIVRRRS